MPDERPSSPLAGAWLLLVLAAVGGGASYLLRDSAIGHTSMIGAAIAGGVGLLLLLSGLWQRRR